MDVGKLLPNSNIIIGNGLTITKVYNVSSSNDEFGNHVYQNRGDNYMLLEVGEGVVDTTCYSMGESKPVDVNFTRSYYPENNHISVNNRVDKIERDTSEVLTMFKILKDNIDKNPTAKACWDQLIDVMMINRNQEHNIEELKDAIERKGLGENICS